MTTAADDSSAGSLREIVANASAGDTVIFAATLFETYQTIHLTQGTLTINQSLTVDGPPTGVALDGNDAATVLSINGSAGDTVVLNNLTIQHGSGSTVGGLVNDGMDTLVLNGCTVTDNTGDGIETPGPLTVTDCSVSVNDGEGIYGDGPMTLTNCIISNNIDGIADVLSNAVITNCTISSNSGAGIWSEESSASISVTNCTITDNYLGVLSNSDAGTLTNDIIYGNSNMDLEDNQSALITVNCDIRVGHGGVNCIDANPDLLALENNGGPVETMALASGSPCLGAGTISGAPITDARGVLRPNPPSMGAYDVAGTEVPEAPTALTATAGSSEITLNWSGSYPAASYNVYRGTASQGESPIPLATRLAATAFADTTAVNGTTYYYTVAGVNPNGVSAPSNEASATPEAPLYPTILVTPGPTITLTATTEQQFSATVYDQHGNPLSPQPSVSWSVKPGGVGSIGEVTGLYHTGHGAGAATIRAKADGLTGTVYVTVVVPTTVSISPGPIVTLGPLPEPQQFTATVLDQNGNPVSPQPHIDWTREPGGVGSISTTGLYHSGTVPGAATISATADGVSGFVTVYDDPPVTISQAASYNPATSTTTTLSALGAYVGNGGAGSLTYMWTETSGPATVSLSANGSNAAASTTATFTQAGTYAFTVTITSPIGTSTTSSVTVTVSQMYTSIEILPGPTLTITAPLPKTQQFTATYLDQFGAAMAVPPSDPITWTVIAGVGSINQSTGLYHSGTVAGTATVKVKDDSTAFSSDCAVTVQ